MEYKKPSPSVDPIFGQVPVFGLNDEDVNPFVVQYLKDVRREALTTNATNYKGANQKNAKYLANIYDDSDNDHNDYRPHDSNSEGNSEARDIVNPNKRSIDDLITQPPFDTEENTNSNPTEQTTSDLPLRLKIFDQNVNQWLTWFKDSKTEILKSAFTTQEYDDDILNLLLFYLKEHLTETKTSNSGIGSHLQNLLKNHKVSNEVLALHSWTIDETWVTPTLARLRSIRIRDIDDIKTCLVGDYKNKKPRNYDQWTRFIRENDPNSSMFSTMITQDDIWIILKFMKQNWLKVMIKTPEKSARTGMWLLYAMFYLSENLNSTQISTLRDFAKKCQRLYLDKFILHSPVTQEDKIPSPVLRLPSEMVGLEILQPQENPTVVELVLLVVSEIFGQKDLLEWSGVVKMD
ncbi:similar to Saccharomyces cerevisiae YPR057W BRR1 snRNP protein component of spliceosomal snRNPs, required for pre-mRNA splicing and snRNP biogenesis [Maudiozyma saulgeensis]|uniref:Similar to Saccharomyces cerevisiae YPR057W BRR1 snRNP protein component of spliceosomal snRNPs, required for pre-mRNA splicing and snRNP biogenesis n=1 Tax=Maudiozyma saulgeensis TaxID=1789683 RepID=A0A1X7R3W6_9SACH|nr:similar to Saccharomyces cerevisiae YPR057W BRR1 snRNP protein component of spliceosomal snRNPs, required for pre-mRNA splicing and snRNP biogenesis [Kazachstania saulgeensis]